MLSDEISLINEWFKVTKFREEPQKACVRRENYDMYGPLAGVGVISEAAVTLAYAQGW